MKVSIGLGGSSWGERACRIPILAVRIAAEENLTLLKSACVVEQVPERQVLAELELGILGHGLALCAGIPFRVVPGGEWVLAYDRVLHCQLTAVDHDTLR